MRYVAYIPLGYDCISIVSGNKCRKVVSEAYEGGTNVKQSCEFDDKLPNLRSRWKAYNLPLI